MIFGVFLPDRAEVHGKTITQTSDLAEWTKNNIPFRPSYGYSAPGIPHRGAQPTTCSELIVESDWKDHPVDNLRPRQQVDCGYEGLARRELLRAPPTPAWQPSCRAVALRHHPGDALRPPVQPGQAFNAFYITLPGTPPSTLLPPEDSWQRRLRMLRRADGNFTGMLVYDSFSCSSGLLLLFVVLFLFFTKISGIPDR